MDAAMSFISFLHARHYKSRRSEMVHGCGDDIPQMHFIQISPWLYLFSPRRNIKTQLVKSHFTRTLFHKIQSSSPSPRLQTFLLHRDTASILHFLHFLFARLSFSTISASIFATTIPNLPFLSISPFVSKSVNLAAMWVLFLILLHVPSSLSHSRAILPQPHSISATPTASISGFV